jgi:type I restriction enzyme, S subunit
MTGEVELAEVCEIRSGGTPSRSNKSNFGGAIPWAKIGDLERAETVIQTEERISESGLKAIRGRMFPKGTLLFAIYGSMGKMAFAGTDLATNQAILGIQPRQADRIDLRYLYFYLGHRLLEIQNAGRGVTQKNLSATYLRELKVPLPQIEEQRRLSTILDKANCIQRNRQKSLRLAENLVRSVFQQMFGDLNANSQGWQTVLLGDILSVDPQNGLYRPAKDYGSGTDILRIDGFYDGYLVRGKALKKLRIDPRTEEKYLLSGGDIVVNRVNSREYLGKSALVEALAENTVFESNMMRFRVSETAADPRFIVDQLQTQFIKLQILRASKDAVNQSSINQTDVKNLEVRLPPVELQRRYAGIVRKKTAADAALHAALEEAQSLFSSLVQRAFRGEL